MTRLLKAISDLSAAVDITKGFQVPILTDDDPDVLERAGMALLSTAMKRHAQLACVNYTLDVSTGDGKGYLHIPAELDGANLVEVHAMVITAGTTGTTDIQIYNLTDTVDMLSTVITIDSGETGSDTAATPAVIDTDNDDVAENDVIRIDVDAVSTTAPKGLVVTLAFQIPEG